MKTWIKMLAIGLLLAAFAVSASAENMDGPLLLVNLPEDMRMVEDVAFEDGDFVQTYQLSGGAYVQLLRYNDFDMTLNDLIVSEWAEATDVQTLENLKIGGLEADGVRLNSAEEGLEPVRVTLVMVKADGCTLVYQAVYPQKLGQEQIDSSVQAMISSMSVLNGSAEQPEVG